MLSSVEPKELQQKIINNINVNRLTVLYGENGVGKSSIIHAGVANRLRLFAQENLIVPEVGVPKLAVIVYDKWEGEILENILSKVRYEISKEIGKIKGQDEKQLEKKLNEKVEHIIQDKQKEAKQKGYYLPCNFIQELEAWAKIIGVKDQPKKSFTSKLFIILDQFESYWLNQQKIEAKSKFEQAFAEAINLPKLSIHFLIAIRSNRFYQLEQHFGKTIPTILDNCIEINYLDTNQAKEAITKSLARYNLINHINTCYLTVLTGEKYSGKSLLLKSGIIPYYQQNNEKK